MDDFGAIMSIFISLCIIIPLIAVVIGSAIWAYGDAERHGKSGCLVALLVLLLSWPVGLIIWLLIRPENEKFK